MNRRWLKLLLTLWAVSSGSGLEGTTAPLKGRVEKPLAVVIPSYNNLQWYRKNLDSILCQKYSNYRILYLDDCSTDGMSAALDDYLIKKRVDCRIVSFDPNFSQDILEVSAAFSALVNEERHRVTLVHNVSRSGALSNIYRASCSCADQEIVVTVDGDDWLSDNQVLETVNSTYSKGKVWLTHGTMMEYPSGVVGWSLAIPKEIVAANAFRKFRCPTHLRTYYAGLFKRIRLEDLLYNGKFFSMTWDMAMMFPMIEMAGERHGFISRVTYVYNMANVINDNKVDPDLQNALDRHIRAMPPYQRIEEGEWISR